MSLATFPENIPQAVYGGYSIQFDARMNEAGFGDGYVQDAPDGENSVLAMLDMRWEALTEAQRDILLDFFFARKGQPFLYTPPRGAERVWKCRQWGATEPEFGDIQVWAKLQEVVYL